MGCWDSVERPKMTSEQFREFVKKCQDAGFIIQIERVSEDRIVEMQEIVRRNPPVDYLSLIK